MAIAPINFTSAGNYYFRNENAVEQQISENNAELLPQAQEEEAYSSDDILQFMSQSSYFVPPRPMMQDNFAMGNNFQMLPDENFQSEETAEEKVTVMTFDANTDGKIDSDELMNFLIWQVATSEQENDEFAMNMMSDSFNEASELEFSGLLGENQYGEMNYPLFPPADNSEFSLNNTVNSYDTTENLGMDSSSYGRPPIDEVENWFNYLYGNQTAEADNSNYLSDDSYIMDSRFNFMDSYYEDDSIDNSSYYGGYGQSVSNNFSYPDSETDYNNLRLQYI